MNSSFAERVGFEPTLPKG